MTPFWKETLWLQFGAAIDSLENAMDACPDNLWTNDTNHDPFWYIIHHTMFWLDLYLDEDPENFHPQKPFGLEELDPAGVFPERAYTKAEFAEWFKHCRDKCRTVIANLTDEQAERPYTYCNLKLTFGQMFLYNMRHVQHGAAQLNLILRQEIDSAPRWVLKSKIGLYD